MKFLKKEQAIIVLGMHRSGTSALSGVLSEMNVFMGSDLYAAQKNVNEKGFFENAKIVDLNEELFDLLFSSWDDPLGYQLDFTETEAISRLKRKAVKLIKKDYSSKLLWGIKDPRVSILLPFWLSVFSELSIKLSYIIMVRHPLEVYRSLLKRDGFSETKSLMLWLNYTLTCLKYCKNSDYQIIMYDDLMSNSNVTIDKLVRNIDMGLLENVGTATQFISSDLRNHSVRFENNLYDNEVIQLSKELYSLLGQENIDYGKVDEINNKYLQYTKSLKGVLSEHLELVKRSEVIYKNFYFNAYNSLWWKIAWPLKKIEHAIIHLLSGDK